MVSSAVHTHLCTSKVRLLSCIKPRKVMATPAVVKGPSCKYFQDFEEACAAYVTKIFPDFKDWKSLGEKTFMFPPCFPCRYLAPTDKASGAMRLTKNEKK